MLYASNSGTVWNPQDDRVTVVARSGEGMEEQRRKEQAEHRVTETGRYVLVQGHKIHSAQSEPECKLRAGGDADMSRQVHQLFTSAPRQWEMLIVGEAVGVWGESVCEASLF